MLQIQTKTITQTCEVEVISIDKHFVSELTAVAIDAAAFIAKTCAVPVKIDGCNNAHRDYSSATLLRGYDCDMNRKAVESAKFIIELYDQVIGQAEV